MAFGKEDRWGYVISAYDNHGWAPPALSRWSEGDSLIEQKAAKELAKAALKVLAELADAPETVMTISVKIGHAIGSPIGEFIKENVVKMMTWNADISLIASAAFYKIAEVDVEITGDFEASYQIKTRADVENLPSLLAVIPATFVSEGDPYYMGQYVVDDCYWLQLQYLQRLPVESSGGTRFKLTIVIDI